MVASRIPATGKIAVHGLAWLPACLSRDHIVVIDKLSLSVDKLDSTASSPHAIRTLTFHILTEQLTTTPKSVLSTQTPHLLFNNCMLPSSSHSPHSHQTKPLSQSTTSPLSSQRRHLALHNVRSLTLALVKTCHLINRITSNTHKKKSNLKHAPRYHKISEMPRSYLVSSCSLPSYSAQTATGPPFPPHSHTIAHDSFR